MQRKWRNNFFYPCFTNKIFISSITSPVMTNNYSRYIIIVWVAMFGFSCTTTYRSETLQYQSYKITNSQPKDSSLLRFLQPYSSNVNRTMNDIVGVAEKSLDKKQPESPLGNFMADVFLQMARDKYNTQVDASLVNFGGIRLNQLPAGDVTTGKVFELMPFDNLLILQRIKGDILQQLLDLTASKGGWPLAGITMQIKSLPAGQTGKKAVNVLIGGKPLDPEKTYTIANSDFIANGGDNADMLRSIPQIANGYLMRDAILDYLKQLKAQGRKINAEIENRVTNAE
jgi:2',3'-cyclic-nucleotide 2'-phosphodiesterase (5'-nucleotidase family)